MSRFGLVEAPGYQPPLLLHHFIVAILLGIYPYLVYRVPSRETPVTLQEFEVSVANTPTSLESNPLFDNYNI